MYAESQRNQPPPILHWIEQRGNRLLLLGAILAANLVSTALHYPHNYIEVAHYPQLDFISNAATRVGILIAWPLLTAFGIVGYWLYARRSYAFAHRCIAAYSVLGIVTLAHFLFGSVHIPAFWYATIFTDAVAGFAILGFVAWSAFVAVPAERDA